MKSGNRKVRSIGRKGESERERKKAPKEFWLGVLFW